MTKVLVCAVAAASMLAAASSVWAQQDPGARAAGGTYVPSTHTPGCGGIMCDSDDPRRAPGAPPPPPCEGLLCGVSPYGMQRPVTAGDVQRMRDEQARAAAAAPAEPVTRSSRKHRKAKTAKKTEKANSVATRTPDPGASAPQAR